MKGRSCCPFLFSLCLSVPLTEFYSSSSWPLLTSHKTPFFLQEQIQVIPGPFCFNHKEYFYTEHEPMEKGRSCLQGPLGWSLFGAIFHPKGMEHMAGVTVTVCRAAEPGRARRLQLAGRWMKCPRTWAARVGRGCRAESCRDKCHFWHPVSDGPPQDLGKLRKCRCSAVCGGRRGCSHCTSALDLEESLEMILPWWELGALAATCVLMPGQKCPNLMAPR